MSSINQMSSRNFENDNIYEHVEASDNNEHNAHQETPLEVVYHVCMKSNSDHENEDTL